MSQQPLSLRDYQAECLQSHYDYFVSMSGNPLFVMPTGSGKSLVIAEFIRTVLGRWPSQRIIVLTHVKELIQQNYLEFLRQIGPLASVGIYSAGLNRRDTDENVIFAGIQSVWPRLEEVSDAALQLGRFDLVLIDEAHLLPKSGEGRYRGYLAWLRGMNPYLKVIGYTATPYRLQGGMLHRGEGRIFTDIVYDVPLDRLIDNGYLSPLVTKAPVTQIDTSGIGSVAGDFNQRELEEAAMSGSTTSMAINEMVRIAEEQGRKHWLVFGCGVDHARQIAETLTEEHGISADCIFGSTHKDDRARIIEEAKAGELTALVNYGVLTTGFNWPQCDLLAMMRPTQSAALYVQIMGRGMRIADGKEDCLVLDYGENVMRHGPINLVGSNEMKSTKGVGEKKDEEKEQKVCETCRGIVPFSSRICPQCGFVLVVEVDVGEEPEPKDPLSGEATTLSILDFQVKERVSETVDVAFTDYVRHMKLGKPDSMRAIYFCGLRSFSEWICFEHGGGAAARARRWWKEHGGNYPPPETVDDALERIEEIDDPVRIVVREDGKYDKIVRAEFEGGQKPERGIQIPEDDIPF